MRAPLLGLMLALNLTSVPLVRAASPAAEPALESQASTATFAFAGDVNLGARMHPLTAGPDASNLLDRVPILAAADAAVVNLETVVSSVGTAVDKPGVAQPYHFRARPETLEVLVGAGIDGVTTANNHVGDYGPDALLEQRELLDSAGIAHAGTGRSMAEACRPMMLEANGLSVAIFSVDTTEPSYAAGPDTPGSCHHPLGDPSGWESILAPRIRDVRERADVVLVGIHWGPNFVDEPVEAERRLGHAIIDAGADGVLGTNAHELQGIEIYRDRPIIHDAAHLLFDFADPVDSAIFELTLTPSGVTRLGLHPIVAEPDRTRMASAEEAEAILDTLAGLSRSLGTTINDGVVELHPPERAPAPSRAPPSEKPMAQVEARQDPPPQCYVEQVPAHAQTDPVDVGPLELVGIEAEPTALPEPGAVRLVTYWRLESAPLDGSIWLSPRGVPGRGPIWRDDHDGCDWAWPVERWTPGTVYRDEFVLRPPDDLVAFRGIPAALTGMAGQEIAIEVGVVDGSIEHITTTSISIPVGWSTWARIAAVGALTLVLAMAALLVALRWRRRQHR